MGANTELAADLKRLHRRWEDSTDVLEQPRSTIDIIEYGLGKQQRAEVYLNHLFCYLLDPEQSHRMGTTFLDAFLSGLPETAHFDEDTYDLSDVQVSQQAPVWGKPSTERDDDATPGYLDLLLEVPNEWFLLVELKFSAKETGTEFYCNASQFGDRLATEYESGHYYLYMHQADRPEARGDCFVNWTWQAFVEDVLDPFLAEETPRYPQRTVVQLHDLRDDIQNIAGMTERSESEREKVALYLEHADAIADVTETFEREWEAYSERWGQAMQESLDHDRVSPTTGTEGGIQRFLSTVMVVTRNAGFSEIAVATGSTFSSMAGGGERTTRRSSKGERRTRTTSELGSTIGWKTIERQLSATTNCGSISAVWDLTRRSLLTSTSTTSTNTEAKSKSSSCQRGLLFPETS